MNGEILVQVENLSRLYGTIEAVKNISFSIRQGQVLGFLGPNGAGKTTTMQILSGNLAPSSGRVRIAGHDLLEEPRAAKRAMGYLPEQPPVYRELTVDEYLDYCAALNGIARRERRKARDAAKEKCGLADVGHRQSRRSRPHLLRNSSLRSGRRADQSQSSRHQGRRGGSGLSGQSLPVRRSGG